MKKLKPAIKEFIRERDWEQYHAPKNLAMALSAEVAEIVEIFQWKKLEDQLSEEEQEALRQEIGDMLIYLIELADKFEIDIEDKDCHHNGSICIKYDCLEHNLPASTSHFSMDTINADNSDSLWIRLRDDSGCYCIQSKRRWSSCCSQCH